MSPSVNLSEKHDNKNKSFSILPNHFGPERVTKRGGRSTLVSVLALALFFGFVLVGTRGTERPSADSFSRGIVDKANSSARDSAKSLAIPNFLFIAAGQGTTGTRSMHDAMCTLGIPSVHYKQSCYQRGETGANMNDTVKMGVEAHYEVISAWQDLIHCAKSRGDCSFSEGLRLDMEVRDRIRSVVRSGIGALHDSPYPKYLPLILNASENSGSAILITSEREPKVWAAKRSIGHSHDIICKNPVAAFDIPLCIALARNADPSPTCFGDVFTSYDTCSTDEERDEFISMMEDAMKGYQNQVIELAPAFRVNFWQETVNTTSLAAGIWNSASKLLPGVLRSSSRFGDALKTEVRRTRKQRQM